MESRFRGYRREAQNLYNEVQSGARPVLAARAHPRNRNKASGGRSTAGADGGGSRARAGGEYLFRVMFTFLDCFVTFYVARNVD